MDSNFQYADAVNLMSPLYAAECSGWVGAPSQHSDSTTPCIKAAWTRAPRPQSVPATHSADFCVVREAVGVGSSRLRYLGAAECSNRRNQATRDGYQLAVGRLEQSSPNGCNEPKPAILTALISVEILFRPAFRQVQPQQ
jgi:hypothetical protein